MLLDKLHFYIALIAGAVMTGVNIYLQASLVDVCIRLIIVLPLFYVIGNAARRYIRKKILVPEHYEVYGEFPLEGEDIISEEPTLLDDEPIMHTDDDLPSDEELPHEENAQ